MPEVSQSLVFWTRRVLVSWGPLFLPDHRGASPGEEELSKGCDQATSCSIFPIPPVAAQPC